MVQMYLQDAPVVVHEGCGVHSFSLVSEQHEARITLSNGQQTLGRANFAEYLGTDARKCSREQLRVDVNPTRSRVKLTSLGSTRTIVFKRDGTSVELERDGTISLLEGYSIAIRSEGEIVMKLKLIDKYDVLATARRLGVPIPREVQVGAVHDLAGGANDERARRPRASEGGYVSEDGGGSQVF